MSFIQSSPLLRNALALDAAACAGMGLLLATAAGPLAAPLGLPEALLRGAGLLLLPCAALLGFLASRKALPRLAVYAVIGINLVWIVDSLAILLLGWFAPTGLGIAFVLAQAAAVAIVTELEVLGLRRSGVALLSHADGESPALR
ncbi:hypothetical protein ARD30_08080 [Bosea thiooxidans]|uniref:Uncharacterized protein n=1 Tax=Bosea thiooxidans TaxID=53254 RepID=A0A0Q3T356_9HYPH|nr:hypothetical protein [Bosea thiooxidans]KQK32098.1 hypothetical protein ARD30_08080 [Bosea thiooxidans]SKB86125.1 hypothetical protein SAMN05660750_02731 [Bosea thiooxidans]